MMETCWLLPGHGLLQETVVSPGMFCLGSLHLPVPSLCGGLWDSLPM